MKNTNRMHSKLGSNHLTVQCSKVFFYMLTNFTVLFNVFILSILKLLSPRVWRKGRATVRRDRSPFDSVDQGGVNGLADGMDRGGALGLSHDKMALVREKKEEIEKVTLHFQFHILLTVRSSQNSWPISKSHSYIVSQNAPPPGTAAHFGRHFKFLGRHQISGTF